MNKTFKLLLVTIVTMVVTTLFVGTSIVGLANPIEQTSASPLDDIINYNEVELYDLHDNVAYLLRFGSMGGYSITHMASGIVCEYDEYRINPYSSTEGRLYYGGPGAYYLMPYAVVGKIGAKEFFNITNEALQQLDSINQGFIEDSQSISIASVTDSTGYTLISQHGFAENYYLSSSLNNDNGCGKAASILLLQ